MTLHITLSQLDNDGEFIDVHAIEEAIDANNLSKLKHMMLDMMPVESRRRMRLGNDQVCTCNNQHLLTVMYRSVMCLSGWLYIASVYKWRPLQ